MRENSAPDLLRKTDWREQLVDTQLRYDLSAYLLIKLNRKKIPETNPRGQNLLSKYLKMLQKQQPTLGNHTAAPSKKCWQPLTAVSFSATSIAGSDASECPLHSKVLRVVPFKRSRTDLADTASFPAPPLAQKCREAACVSTRVKDRCGEDLDGSCKQDRPAAIHMPFKGLQIWGEVTLFPFRCLRIQAKTWPTHQPCAEPLHRQLHTSQHPNLLSTSQHLPSHSHPRWKSSQTSALGNFYPWSTFPDPFLLDPTSSPCGASAQWHGIQAPPPPELPRASQKQDFLPRVSMGLGQLKASSGFKQPRFGRVLQRSMARGQRPGPELFSTDEPGRERCQSC